MSEAASGVGAPRAGATGRRRGTVAEFDEAVGLGYVDVAAGAAQGGRRLRFHCTQIADGSRVIPSGTSVTFVVIAGRGGDWEAGDLRPAPEATAP